jgi:hypothetical protein
MKIFLIDCNTKTDALPCVGRETPPFVETYKGYNKTHQLGDFVF